MKFRYLFAKLFKKMHSRAVLRSVIHASSKIEAGSEVVNSTFDRYSFCGYYCEVFNTDIGSFCSIANHVVIGGEAHPTSWASTSPAFYHGRDSIRVKFSEHQRLPAKRTTIGHDVWIGERAMIKQGVSVGTGAVIGMGSVVTRDVPPYAVAVGCPAKVVRYRFTPDLISELLKSEWWLMDDGIIRRAAVHIKEPSEFLREIVR